MTLDFHRKVHPSQGDEKGAAPLSERTNQSTTPRHDSRPLAKGVLEYQRGGCLPCGSSSTERDDGVFVYLTTTSNIERAFQEGPAVLWSELDYEGLTPRQQPKQRPLHLVYRLGSSLYGVRLLLDKNDQPEFGKLKPLHKGSSSKVSSESEATWRFILPSSHQREVLRELVQTLLPQFRILIRDIQDHPGFAGDDTLCDLPDHTLTLRATKQGVLMTQLSPDRASIQQALVRLNMNELCLEICGAVDGKLIDGQGTAFNTLRGAVTAFDSVAKATPLQSAQLSTENLCSNIGAAAHRSAPHAVASTVAPPAGTRGAVIHAEDVVGSAVSNISSGDEELLRQGLEIIMDCRDQHPGDDSWTAEWRTKGAFEALIRAATLGVADEDDELDYLLQDALGLLISCTAAAELFVDTLKPALEHYSPPPEGSTLLHLTMTVLAIPAVCQAAGERGLRQVLVDLFIRLKQDRPAASTPDKSHSCLNQAVLRFSETPRTPPFSTDTTPRRSPSRLATMQVSGAKLRQALSTSQLGALEESPALGLRRQRHQSSAALPRVRGPGSEEDDSPTFQFSERLLPLRPADDESKTPNLRIKVPSLNLASVESSPLSTAKPSRSARRKMQNMVSQAGSPADFVRGLGADGFPMPTSGRSDEPQRELTAKESLLMLGSAMGEGLVAGDLASLMAHKRSASMRHRSSSGSRSAAKSARKRDNVRSHSLFGEPEMTPRSSDSRSPLSTARDSEFGHHTARALGTSRLASHRSQMSQESLAEDGEPPAAAHASRRMILRALVSLAPLVSDKEESALGCAKAVAEELVAEPGCDDAQEAAGAEFRRLALDVILLYEAPLQASSKVLLTGQAASLGTGRPQRPLILLPRLAAKMEDLLDILDRQEMSKREQHQMGMLLDLLQSYLSKSSAPSLHSRALQAIYTPLQRTLHVLSALGHLSTWAQDAVQLLRTCVHLLIVLLQRCQDQQGGQMLLELLVADVSVQSMLYYATLAALLPSELQSYREGIHGPLSRLRLPILQMFAELTALIGQQPAESEVAETRGEQRHGADCLLASANFRVDGPSEGLSRERALVSLAFLVDYPQGAVFHTLAKGSKLQDEASEALSAAALELLSATAAAPGNPLLRSKERTDQIIHLLWMNFAILYTNPLRGPFNNRICRLYLKVLRELARHKTAEIRRRFLQMRVMDFLVRELSLEQDVHQHARLPQTLHMAAASGPPLTAMSPPPGNLTLAFRAVEEAGVGIPANQPVVPKPSSQPKLMPRIPMLDLQRPDAVQGGNSGPKSGTYRSSDFDSFDDTSFASTSDFTASLDSRRRDVASRQASQDGGAEAARAVTTSVQASKPPFGVPSLNSLVPPSQRRLPKLQLPLRASAPAIGQAVRDASLHSSTQPAAPVTPSSARGKPPLVPKLSVTGAQGRKPALSLSLPGLPLKLGFADSALLSASQGLGGVIPDQGSPRASPRIGAGGRRISQTSTVPSSRLQSSHAASQLMEDSSPPTSESSALVLPPGFVSTGDIDEDCELLERLELEQEEREMDESEGSGIVFPPGFQSTGDLEEDLDLLEEMEAQQRGDQASESGEDSVADGATDPETASLFSLPSIPRSFGRPAFLPRLPGLGGQVSISESDLGPLLEESGSPGEAPAIGGSPSSDRSSRTGLPIPRLNLAGAVRAIKTPQQQIPQDTVAGVSSRLPSLRLSLTAKEEEGMHKGKMQAAQRSAAQQPQEQELSNPADEGAEDILLPSVSYEELRQRRHLYSDDELHLLVLEVVLDLLITESGDLDSAYTCNFPLENRMQNAMHILHHHLSHTANAVLLPRVMVAAAAIGPSSSLLLRILCRPLFPTQLYNIGSMIARGAYARVHHAQATGSSEPLVVKVVDIPKSGDEPCAQVDIFTEIRILEKLQGSGRVSRLYDYGIDEEHFVLVMRHYPTSLEAWRARLPKDPAGNMRLFLRIFLAVVQAVKDLRAANVVHFDIKAENILLEPLPGCSPQEFWNPASDRLPFKVILADFGESRMFSSMEDRTVRNRGTEYIKSPEMLQVANTGKKEAMFYDRRRRQGAGAPSDIWSLGCLLFQIITHEYLFYDKDWIRFYLMVTQGENGEVLPTKSVALIAAYPGVLDLLKYILARQPIGRPSPDLIIGRALALINRLPPHGASTSRHTSSQDAAFPVAQVQHTRLVPAPFYASHPSMRENVIDGFWAAPTPVTDNLFLGSLRTLQNLDELTKLGITHAVFLCNAHLDDGSCLKVETCASSQLLKYLNVDAKSRFCISSCASADILCHLVPVLSQTVQDGKVVHELLPQIPEILQLLARIIRGGQRVLLAGSDGFVGDAAVAAIAHRMNHQKCSCYEAFIYLLHQNAALQLQDFNMQQLQQLGTTT